jgi:hypothetical protein
MNARSSYTNLPPISAALIKSLEEVYPSQDFTPSKGVRDLDYHYGQRSVVNFLKHTYQIQNENILTKE